MCGGAVALTAVSCPHCGHGSAIARSGLSGGAISVALAGALIAAASILPWETLLGVGFNGFQVGNAGVFCLGIGLVVGLPGLTQIEGRGLGTGTRALAFLGGLAAVGLALLGFVQVHKQTLNSVIGSVGVGVFVVAIGGGLAIAAALLADWRSD